MDTGPVQERVYAQYAGLGWIGKNSCLINPEVGSWVLLGAILCSLPLEPDAPGVDQCGTCTLCLEACPTAALVEPHVLDATRCLSYLTVEYRGADSRTASRGDRQSSLRLRHLPGSLPVERRADRASDPSWSSREDLNVASLIDLWRKRDEELEQFIGTTPMTRAGVKGLRRNLAVALGNAGDPRALEALNEPRDQSASDPLVVEHVEWAKRKLASSALDVGD